MEKRRSKVIGPPGYWICFSGIPFAVCVTIFVLTEPKHVLERVAGERLFPYVLYFLPGLVIVLFGIVYDYFPRRLMIPTGIPAWIFGFALLCWFFWFGPGAL